MRRKRKEEPACDDEATEPGGLKQRRSGLVDGDGYEDGEPQELQLREQPSPAANPGGAEGEDDETMRREQEEEQDGETT